MTSDELSKPMRRAIEQWGLEYRVGFSSYWDSFRSRWIYSLSSIPISVEIVEDGTAALVWTDPRAVKSLAKTPRGLRMLLTRMYREGNK